MEKEQISNRACCGAYAFESWRQLRRHCRDLIEHGPTQKGEYYMSGVIQWMMQKGAPFAATDVPNRNYFSLGTPEQAEEYEQVFLFDLDGTWSTQTTSIRPSGTPS